MSSPTRSSDAVHGARSKVTRCGAAIGGSMQHYFAGPGSTCDNHLLVWLKPPCLNWTPKSTSQVGWPGRGVGGDATLQREVLAQKVSRYIVAVMSIASLFVLIVSFPTLSILCASLFPASLVLCFRISALSGYCTVAGGDLLALSVYPVHESCKHGRRHRSRPGEATGR